MLLHQHIHIYHQFNRTISLISHASKIILKKILTKRIEAKATAVNWITNEQFGFRKGLGIGVALGVLRTLGERSLQHNKDLYGTCFIDYEKAFDRVNWYKLMRALARLGVDWRDRRLIYRSYKNHSVVIRVNSFHSDTYQNLGARKYLGGPVTGLNLEPPGYSRLGGYPQSVNVRSTD